MFKFWNKKKKTVKKKKKIPQRESTIKSVEQPYASFRSTKDSEESEQNFPERNSKIVAKNTKKKY